MASNQEEEVIGKAYDSRLMRRLLTYLRPYKWHVVIALVAIVLKSVADVLGPFLTKIAIDKYLAKAPNSHSWIGDRLSNAPLAGIAPRLVRALYDPCRGQKLFEARPAQEQAAALRQAVKDVASLKAALRAMERDCGEPRPPLLPLDAVAYQKLIGELDAIAALRAEPRGW